MSADGSFRRLLVDPNEINPEPDEILPEHLALENSTYDTRYVDLSPLAYRTMMLQSAIRRALRSQNIGIVVRTLKEFNNGELPDANTIHQMLDLQIPGQTTISQELQALPDNDFKNQLMDVLHNPTGTGTPSMDSISSSSGGKKRRSKFRSRSKKISSRSRSKKSRKSRSRRRYRK
jgi:hypothetical protein